MTGELTKAQAWGLDSIIMERGYWFGVRTSTVVCSLNQGAHYAAQGYRIDWTATMRCFGRALLDGDGNG